MHIKIPFKDLEKKLLISKLPPNSKLQTPTHYATWLVNKFELFPFQGLILENEGPNLFAKK